MNKKIKQTIQRVNSNIYEKSNSLVTKNSMVMRKMERETKRPLQ